MELKDKFLCATKVWNLCSNFFIIHVSMNFWRLFMFSKENVWWFPFPQAVYQSFPLFPVPTNTWYCQTLIFNQPDEIWWLLVCISICWFKWLFFFLKILFTWKARLQRKRSSRFAFLSDHCWHWISFHIFFCLLGFSLRGISSKLLGCFPCHWLMELLHMF